ncbi:MAG: phospho-N-acetylmuramoyl-pentapeptide-transferase [Prochlorococcus sp.]
MSSQRWWDNGTTSATLLAIIVFATSFASDRLIANSLLSVPLMVSTLISVVVASWGIPRLKALKMGQVIREDGPQTHHSKSGTPTMGGLLVVPVGLLIGCLVSVSGESSEQLVALAAITLAYMVIGGFDDWRSLTRGTNTGLTPQGKLLLQAIAAMIFLAWAAWQGWIDSSIALPLGMSMEIGLMIWPLALFVFLAESNATNLTDGLDGLASGCGALVFTGLAVQLMLRGNNGDPVLAGFCMAMAGAWLGFLIHNRNPARIFMGDTGSLAMGAALSGVAILSNSLWPLLVMGGVFLAESLSVIIQVWVFKATKGTDGIGKRIFKMAPLHHHFEIEAANEQTVVRSFWLVTGGLVLLGLLLPPTS